MSGGQIMVRGALGLVVGVILWMAVFYALAVGLALAWPDYALNGRNWTRQGVFTFTPLMACCNLAFWMIADIAAGWVTGRVTKRREMIWTLAILLGIYLAVLHVAYWSRFPWWYNLGVIVPTVPAVILGGRISLARAVQD